LRTYHFVNRQFGLDDIQRRRLKIATLNELNDPFELFGISLHDVGLRHAFREMKQQLSTNRGLLCFSRKWSNPVQWSHYAEKHRGLCLGFDVEDASVGQVSYSRRRLVVEAEKLRDPRQLDPDLARRFLFTKYSHWRYEDEVRCFVTLQDKDPSTGLYFAEFSDSLRLRQVIVGAESTVTRQELRNALGDLTETVDVFKTRLAFRSFRVVRQRNERLWA
jgi:hypothetical protein